MNNYLFVKGLDPAGPGFGDKLSNQRLLPTDAM